MPDIAITANHSLIAVRLLDLLRKGDTMGKPIAPDDAWLALLYAVVRLSETAPDPGGCIDNGISVLAQLGQSLLSAQTKPLTSAVLAWLESNAEAGKRAAAGEAPPCSPVPPSPEGQP